MLEHLLLATAWVQLQSPCITADWLHSWRFCATGLDAPQTGLCVSRLGRLFVVLFLMLLHAVVIGFMQPLQDHRSRSGLGDGSLFLDGKFHHHRIRRCGTRPAVAARERHRRCKRADAVWLVNGVLTTTTSQLSTLEHDWFRGRAIPGNHEHIFA